MEECRYLIVGVSGYVGGALGRHLARTGVTAGTRCHSRQGGIRLDITDESSVRRVIRQLRPEFVVSAAALADVDECARDEERSRLVNVVGPQNLARVCAAFDAALVHLSTDYVFDGLDGPYSEDDATHPINTYGRHKAEAEQRVLDTTARAIVVRTSTVFGGAAAEDGGMVARVLHAAKHRTALDLSPRQLCSPTHVDDLAEGVLQLVNAQCRGIYHIAGADVISRYELGRKIAESLGVNPEMLRPGERPAAPGATRPLRCGLLIEKARRDVGYRPRSLAVGVREAAKGLMATI